MTKDECDFATWFDLLQVNLMDEAETLLRYAEQEGLEGL